MKHDHACRQARLHWMEHFDGGRPEAPLPVALAAHLHRCSACREFTHGAEVSRSVLSAIPLPPANAAADHALLAALCCPEPPAVRWRDRFRAFLAGFGGPGLRPVLIAGAASFAITLAAGTALTVGPADSPLATAPQPEPAPTRRAERDLETRLEDWLSHPAARPRPPQSLPPARPRPAPARPRERSDRGTRFHAA